MFAYYIFDNFQSLSIFNQILLPKILQLAKGIFQKLKRMSFLLVILLKLKLKFNGEQNVAFVFSYYLFSQLQDSFDCLVEVQLEALNVSEDIFEQNFKSLKAGSHFANTQL